MTSPIVTDLSTACVIAETRKLRLQLPDGMMRLLHSVGVRRNIVTDFSRQVKERQISNCPTICG